MVKKKKDASPAMVRLRETLEDDLTHSAKTRKSKKGSSSSGGLAKLRETLEDSLTHSAKTRAGLGKRADAKKADRKHLVNIREAAEDELSEPAEEKKTKRKSGKGDARGVVPKPPIIEDLINTLPDAQLRARVLAEMDRLRKAKETKHVPDPIAYIVSLLAMGQAAMARQQIHAHTLGPYLEHNLDIIEHSAAQFNPGLVRDLRSMVGGDQTPRERPQPQPVLAPELTPKPR